MFYLGALSIKPADLGAPKCRTIIGPCAALLRFALLYTRSLYPSTLFHLVSVSFGVEQISILPIYYLPPAPSTRARGGKEKKEMGDTRLRVAHPRHELRMAPMGNAYSTWIWSVNEDAL